MSTTATTLALPNLELVSTLRVSPLNGPPDSNDYNDGEQEKLIDLTVLVTFLNDVLLPMLNTLGPASETGIDGSGIYSDLTSQEVIFYNSNTGQSMTLADTLRYLAGQLQTMQTAQSSVVAQVAALQARLASTNQNDISLALQGFTANLNSQIGQINALQQAVSNLQLLAGTSLDARVESPVIAPGSTESVMIEWSVPFPDNNYTVAYGIEDGSGFLQVTGFTYLPSGAGIVVRVNNLDTLASHQGTVNAEGRVSQLAAS
jgi:hypothetical protein